MPADNRGHLRYCIDAAFERASTDAGVVDGPAGRQNAPDWGLVYTDSAAIDAQDDAGAVDRAEALQRRHDGAYLLLCDGRPPSNWEGRPRYVDCLFRLHPDQGLEPVVA